MGIFDELAQLGTAISQFNQTSFRGNTIGFGSIDIRDGYCSGVCLDWMRRVLLSKPQRDPAFLGYERTKSPDNTLKRMAIAYREHAPTYNVESKQVSVSNVLNELKRLPEARYNLDGKIQTGVLIPRTSAKLLKQHWPQLELDATKDPAGVLPKSRLDSLLGGASGIAERARSVSGREWKTLASELDDDFKRIRLGESRQVTKKSFSSVQVRRSSTSKQYDSAGHWSAELRTNAYQENCCTILSFSHTGGSGGHAVAVYQNHQDYLFFDPNFGTFKYTQDGLKKALQHLFWAPAIAADAGVLDGEKAVYLRRQKPAEPVPAPMNDVGYTIFERAPQ